MGRGERETEKSRLVYGGLHGHVYYVTSHVAELWKEVMSVCKMLFSIINEPFFWATVCLSSGNICPTIQYMSLGQVTRTVLGKREPGQKSSVLHDTLLII